jgi:hypothetical protein
MAHWAEVDENNIVIRVLVTDNELEDEGYDWLINTFGGKWVKTSYNTFAGKHKLGGTSFRYNFACPGYSWNENFGIEGAFIAPKPDGEEWTLDPEKLIWIRSS